MRPLLRALTHSIVLVLPPCFARHSPSPQVFAAVFAAVSAAASTAAPRAVLFVKHVSGASDRLFAELKQRSDPKSDLYLDWLSQDQVGGILQPHPEHLATVLTIAAEFGAHAANGGVDVIGTGDKVVVNFPGVAAVPAAFLAKAAASGALDVAPSTNTNADASFHTSFDVSMPPRLTAKPRRQAETSKGLRRADSAQATSSSTIDPQACLANIMGVDGACVRAAYGLTGTAAGKLAAGQAFVVNQPFSQRCVGCGVLFGVSGVAAAAGAAGAAGVGAGGAGAAGGTHTTGTHAAAAVVAMAV